MKTEASAPERRYWVQVFSADTWNRFVESGAGTTGFRDNRWGFVRKLKPGDYLLCYLSRVCRWVGILEVASEPYLDTSRIWKEELYPCRVDVKVVASLRPDDGVPIKEMVDMLTIFRIARWSLYLMASPTLWREDDGKAVVEVVTAKVDSLNATARSGLQ